MKRDSESNEKRDDQDEMAGERVELRLYVAGQTSRSLTAIDNLRRICEENLKGRYTIEVIDLLQSPNGPAGTRSWPSPPWSRSSRRLCARSSATFRTRNES